MIASGEAKPGQMSPLRRDFAQTFKSSGTALHEALKALKTLGFIRIEPSRDAIVNAEANGWLWRLGFPIPKAAVFQLCFLIDSDAAKLAAGVAGPADPEGLARSIENVCARAASRRPRGLRAA